MMTLQNLVKNTEWKKIELNFFELYPEKREHLSLFKKYYWILHNEQPKKRKTNTVLTIEKFKNDTFTFYDILGKTNHAYHGLELFPPEEWLSFIIPKSLQPMRNEEIICHCLHEMSFIDLNDSIDNEYK